MYLVAFVKAAFSSPSHDWTSTAASPDPPSAGLWNEPTAPSAGVKNRRFTNTIMLVWWYHDKSQNILETSYKNLDPKLNAGHCGIDWPHVAVAPVGPVSGRHIPPCSSDEHSATSAALSAVPALLWTAWLNLKDWSVRVAVFQSSDNTKNKKIFGPNMPRTEEGEISKFTRAAQSNSDKIIITGSPNLHEEAALPLEPPTAGSLADAPAHSALFCLFPSWNNHPSSPVSLLTAPSADSGEKPADAQCPTQPARREETNKDQKIYNIK